MNMCICMYSINVFQLAAGIYVKLHHSCFLFWGFFFCISVSLSVAVVFTFSWWNKIESQKNKIKMCPGHACFSIIIPLSGYTSCEHQNKLVCSTRRVWLFLRENAAGLFYVSEKASFSCFRFFFLCVCVHITGKPSNIWKRLLNRDEVK